VAQPVMTVGNSKKFYVQSELQEKMIGTNYKVHKVLLTNMDKHGIVTQSAAQFIKDED
jgi:uncharacterized protein YvpB